MIRRVEPGGSRLEAGGRRNPNRAAEPGPGARGRPPAQARGTRGEGRHRRWPTMRGPKGRGPVPGRPIRRRCGRPISACAPPGLTRRRLGRPGPPAAPGSCAPAGSLADRQPSRPQDPRTPGPQDPQVPRPPDYLLALRFRPSAPRPESVEGDGRVHPHRHWRVLLTRRRLGRPGPPAAPGSCAPAGSLADGEPSRPQDPRTPGPQDPQVPRPPDYLPALRSRPRAPRPESVEGDGRVHPHRHSRVLLTRRRLGRAGPPRPPEAARQPAASPTASPRDLRTSGPQDPRTSRPHEHRVRLDGSDGRTLSCELCGS
jgi:hypothetical protein